MPLLNSLSSINEKRQTKNEKKCQKKRHFRVKIRKKYCRFFYAIDIHFRRTHWLATNSDYCIKKNYQLFLVHPLNG